MHGHGGKGFVAVRRFHDFVDLRKAGDERAQSAPHQRVVIREQQSHVTKSSGNQMNVLSDGADGWHGSSS